MKNSLIISALIMASAFCQVSIAQEGPNRPRPQPPGTPLPPPPPPEQPGPNNVEQRLQTIIAQQNLQAIDPSSVNVLPATDAKVQLGKKLFFTKNLGGEQSVACASCHHPSLGGGDDISLSVGISAVNAIDLPAEDLLGHGRFNGDNLYPVVPRNAPTIFNIALYQRGLFWDSRVERLRNGAIVTPDSAVDANGRRAPDSNLSANTTLANAQARFPVTSVEEMRGDFAQGQNNQSLRTALVDRLNNDIANISSTWPQEFSQVFGDQQVTTDRVFDAIGEYERSMLFVNNPWSRYLAGDSNALTDDQKIGAVLFFTPSQQNGAGCSACHNGANFTDSRHHLVAFPQIGIGKGNVSQTATSQDFGRENVSNNSNDKFHFRTPSLLNVAATAPYGHTGAYQSLEEAIAHYNNPRQAIDRLFAARNQQPFVDGEAPYCQLPQIQALMTKHNIICEEVFSDSYANSIEVAQYLQAAVANQVPASAPLRARINLSPIQIQQVASFLHALTDPCVESRSCLAPWTLDDNDVATFPDDHALEAVDANGQAL